MKRQQGFTLIELMLSMTFVATLLIAVAMCAIQISTIYQRGLTLKEVNQSGRAIVKDFQSTINTSAPFSLETAFVTSLSGTAPISYRLCTGTYTYLINTAAAIKAPSNGNVITYAATPGGASSQLPRLVRVRDTKRYYCQKTTTAPSATYPTIRSTDDPIELLEATDRSLIVHSFSITRASGDVSASQAIYSITFILGTSEDGTIDTSNYTCKAPKEEANNFTYCAVNDFHVTARAGNAL